jgi:peptidoglycan/LPS O-acetylase OafA/YrhL
VIRADAYRMEAPGPGGPGRDAIRSDGPRREAYRVDGPRREAYRDGPRREAYRDGPRREAPRPVPASAPTIVLQRGHRRDIAGLRGIAILLVVLHDAGVDRVAGGFVGIDAFLVVAGFLATTALVRELSLTGRIPFGRYYTRRALRLVPVPILVTLATIVATWHWAPPAAVHGVVRDALAGISYLLNVRLALHGAPPGVPGVDSVTGVAGSAPSPLWHLWTVAVGAQFYLIWPVLLTIGSLVWLGRRRPRTGSIAVLLAVLGVASLGLCGWQARHTPSWAYFGLPARLWEFVAGALVALAAERLVRLRRAVAAPLTWVGLALLIFSALSHSDTVPSFGYPAVLPVAGTVALIAGGCAGSRYGVIFVLRAWPVQELGRLSYGWYLWHWPVLVLAPYVLGHQPATWIRLVLVVAALAPAATSVIAIEDRIRFNGRLRPRPRQGLLFSAGLTAVAGAAVLLSLGLPLRVAGRPGDARVLATGRTTSAAPVTAQQLAELIQASSYTSSMPGEVVPDLRVAAGDRPADGACLAPPGQAPTASGTPAGCLRFGDPAGRHIAVLFGDSHAEQWFDAVDLIARQQHWRLVVFLRDGCPAATVDIHQTGRPYRMCAQWRKAATAQINRMHPGLVIMSSLADETTAQTAVRDVSASTAGGRSRRPVSGDAALAAAWLSTVHQLAPSRARLVAIEDTPDPRTLSVPDCIWRNKLDIRRCNLAVRQSVPAARAAAIGTALRHAAVRVIDPTAWFCTAALCPAIVGHTVVYRDASHISATYIKLLASLLAPLLEAR